MKLFKRLFREEEGANLVEYALLVAFIALVVIGGATVFGSALNAWFVNLKDQVPGQ